MTRPDIQTPDDLPTDPEGRTLRASRTWLAKHAETLSDSLDLPPSASELPAMAATREPGWIARGSGTFKNRDVIGEGGFGEVWAARQASLGRLVALKAIRPDITASVADSPERLRELEESFEYEALTLAALEHPNIVPVYDLVRDGDDRPAIAMKYIRGKPWNELIKAEYETLSRDAYLEKHLPIMVQVAQAVAFAHSRGIIHRDIKPHQVAVGEFGEVVLMDWGLAMVFDEELLAEKLPSLLEDPLPNCRRSQNPSGTLAFMAPEQTTDTACDLGPWTDVYLLGATLFYVLSKQPPHPGEDSRSIFYKAALGEIRPITKTLGADSPRDLVDLALKAMVAEHSERKLTAAEFVDRLQDYLRGTARRQESMALVQNLQDRVGTGSEMSYRDHARLIYDLNHALQLWPGNMEARVLLLRARENLIRDAIVNGDIALARIEAEVLPDGTARDELVAMVEGAESTTRRRNAWRRTLTAAVFVALAILLFLNVWMTMRLVNLNEGPVPTASESSQ
ncbi:MAG: serine/threonine-protein kinase [Sumerlaeia bacterium]